MTQSKIQFNHTVGSNVITFSIPSAYEALQTLYSNVFCTFTVESTDSLRWFVEFVADQNPALGMPTISSSDFPVIFNGEKVLCQPQPVMLQTQIIADGS